MSIFSLYQLQNEDPIVDNAIRIHTVVGWHSHTSPGANKRLAIEAWRAHMDELEWEVGQEWYCEG